MEVIWDERSQQWHYESDGAVHDAFWPRGLEDRIRCCEAPSQYVALDGSTRQWIYSDEERPEGVCYDCRQPIILDLIVPNSVWVLLNPTHHDGAGLLCSGCIRLRLADLGLYGVPAVFVG